VHICEIICRHAIFKNLEFGEIKKVIKAGVTGALGKMGSEVIKTIISNSENKHEMELVCAVDKFGAGQNVFQSVNIEGDLAKAIEASKPDVMVDFTQPSCVFENAKTYLNMKVKSVIGTTGLKKEQIEELKNLSKQNNTGCIIAPNFAVGAVLMMMFSKMASKYFNNAEIIEMHHNQKKDAPSGTAIKTAQVMAAANPDLAKGNVPETELIEGARGGNFVEDGRGNIKIHSVRMPGFVASQEVIFGALGQTLKIRHDTIDRKCFMSGVELAIKYVYENNEFIYGLENIL